jgi:hypothetical protein
VQGLCDTSGAACRIDAGGAVISPAAAPARR